MPPLQAVDCLRLVRPPAGQQFVEQAADGVDVGAGVDRLATPLLGGHVGGRAAGAGDLPAGTGGGDGLVGRHQPRLAHQLGQAEVGELGQLALGHQHVVGLDVAVHEAGHLLLGMGQGAADVGGELQGAAGFERAAAAQPVAQVGAVPLLTRYPLQEQEGGVVDRVHVEASDDVGVLLQRHPGGGLALEVFLRLGVCQVARLEGLEGIGQVVWRSRQR